MKALTFATKTKDEVLDITDQVESIVKNTGIASGVCTVFIAHTTACLTTADLDPGTDLDLLDALRSLLPKDLHYRHPHNPSHAPDHILSSIIGPTVTVPFLNSALQLGTWQRIILIELDGPRERTVRVSVIGEADERVSE